MNRYAPIGNAPGLDGPPIDPYSDAVSSRIEGLLSDIGDTLDDWATERGNEFTTSEIERLYICKGAGRYETLRLDERERAALQLGTRLLNDFDDFMERDAIR
ncbi:MAG TPA: hypothetical protein VNM48_00195, partial [Chloroflexota bacterium]|nr:hypothetical protein [Chloroflexota bacterium]